MILTEEQEQILSHTLRRAANRMYCVNANDPLMVALVDLDLMERAGTASWLAKGEAFFTITARGRAHVVSKGL